MVSAPASGIPPHENFEETSLDLVSLVASLADVKSLCEDSLQSSFDARGNLTVNKTIVLVFSDGALAQSRRTSEALQENLSGFSGYLETLRDNAESYSYLKDLFVPLQSLGLNVTVFVEAHRSILENLTASVTFINQGGDATEAVVSLGNIRSAVTTGRTTLQNIERYISVIQSNYSVDTLQSLVSSLYLILETYDAYSSSLLELCNGVNPYLVLHVDESVVSLGTVVTVSGYFIAQRRFVSNQTIDIQMEHHTLITTSTDRRGGYTAAIPISLTHPLGTFWINASTIYKNKVYHADPVCVTIQRIPTNLTFFTNATHVYMNESFHLFGRLIDDNNSGIHAIVTVHIAGENSSVETDEMGNFTTVFIESLPFGVYPMFVSFDADEIYAPCESRRITISVDTPTLLTLFTSITKVSAGETVVCTGQLNSLIDGSPVLQKPITILLNNKQVASGTTNTTGWFTVDISTRAVREGVSLVSARFTTDEPQWRNATSNEIELTIMMGFPYWDILLIIGAVAALVPVFFFFRRRVITLRKKRPSLDFKTPPKTSVSAPPLKPFPVDDHALLQNISSHNEGEIREGIISQYHVLIRLLSRTGLVFPPSSTHLDIKNMLIQKGLSKNETEVITGLFELAQYSPVPLGTKEAAMFNTNIHALVNTLGDYSWTRQ